MGIKSRASPKREGVRCIIRKTIASEICRVALSQGVLTCALGRSRFLSGKGEGTFLAPGMVRSAPGPVKLGGEGKVGQ